MNRGNQQRQRTPAQLAHIAAMRIRARKGRPPKEQPEPFGRVRSGGLFGVMMKTQDAETRALIDAAVAAKRAQEQTDA